MNEDFNKILDSLTYLTSGLNNNDSKDITSYLLTKKTHSEYFKNIVLMACLLTDNIIDSKNHSSVSYHEGMNINFLFSMLHSFDHYSESEKIEIAKGLNKKPESWSEGFKQIKRVIKWHKLKR